MGKKRAKGLAVFILAMVFLAGSAVFHAPTEVKASAGKVTKAETPKNKFVKKNGKLYFYDANGKIVKGWYTNKSGVKYYFGTDGAVRSGWLKLKGEYYYFSDHGKMMTNCFVKNGKSTYYLTEKGIKAKGRYKVKKDWYSFHRETGQLVRSGWYKETDGSYYYAGANGKLVKGFYKPDAYYRYFRPSDCKLLTGWQNIDGNRYYFKPANGIRYDNRKVTISGKMYYFSTNGRLFIKKWFTKNGATYYAGAEGVLAVGWLNLGGNTYYLDSKTGERKTGWLSLKGEKYYLNPTTGILARNKWIDKETYVGENGALIPGYAGHSFRWPLSSGYAYITSYFGHRESPGGIGSTDHKGIDISAPTGTRIYAAESGTILAMKKASESGGSGNYTIIDHGKGVYTEYMHQDSFYSRLKVGDKVLKGDLIGFVGTTGNVTGAHLHFGVLVNGVNRNPLDYVKQPGMSRGLLFFEPMF